MSEPRLAIPLLLVSSAVLLFLSGSTWIRRKNAGYPAVFLSLCMAGAALYNFGYAMELSADNMDEVMTWVRFQHLGIEAIAPTWLLFSLHISGNGRVITSRRLVLLISVPVFLFLSAQTLGDLNLYHISPRIDSSGAFSFFTYDRGLVAWISVTYMTFCVMASTVLFSIMFHRTSPAFRKQAMIFLSGSIIPWLVMVLYMFGASPRGLDIVPFALTLSGALFSFGLFRYRILDIVPLARDAVFECMNDGVLVLDNLDRIIDFNSCLKDIVPEINPDSVGTCVFETLSKYPDLLRCIGSDPSDELETDFKSPDSPACFKCRASSLVDWQGYQAGKIIMLSNFTQARQLMGQLEKLAALDGLTGIYNRRHFEDVAAREVYRFQRYGGSISLIMLDLDHFKNINDAHGHAAGDAVLVSAAKTLASCLRKSDIMGRFGGEEFIVLLPETDRAAAIAIAEKMRQALESLMVRFQEQSFRVTASFGVTGVTSPESATPEIFFERADRALYEAKEKGRNRVCAA